MYDYRFKVLFRDGSSLVTTVSAASRFIAETILCEMYPEARFCDFISIN